MTVVSLVQAARRLGIDAKTLHRWLAEAGLAVQSHPTDRRQKGVSSDHLHTLARLHQRTLTSLPAESPALGVSTAVGVCCSAGPVRAAGSPASPGGGLAAAGS